MLFLMISNLWKIGVISGYYPQMELNAQVKLNLKKIIIIPPGIDLADPTFDKPGRIDMLIGAGFFWRILEIGNHIQNTGNLLFKKLNSDMPTDFFEVPPFDRRFGRET